MHAKTVLITGANRGIGFYTAKGLAKMGARIVMACRDLSKSIPQCERIQIDAGHSEIEVMHVDLASLNSIRSFSNEFQERYSQLDILINNAGVFRMKREETEDGFEKTIGTNYLGPFLLTHLLLPCIMNSTGAQIINISSNAHYYGNLNLKDLQRKRRYQGFLAYAASKLALVFFTQELTKRLKDKGIRVNAVHPGHVATNMWELWPEHPRLQSMVNAFLGKLMISPEEGAETVLYLATSEEVKGITGKYFDGKKQREASRKCKDVKLQKELWQLSERLTGLAG
jgi:NAD(P)-dependent dehydrogenase (short-subunit alcohol dehydrogenase family)